MDLIKPVAETAGAPKFHKAATIFLAVAAVFLVLVAVAVHWASYNLLRKALAVILLLNVLVGSVRARIIQEKQKVPEMLIQQSYVWLLLATMLFSGLASKLLP